MIPLFDLSRQNQQSELTASIKSAIDRVLGHQQFILGKEVVELEKEIESTCFDNKAHVIGVSSGTDGLLAILMAKGIGPGDAVITTPYTFFATASCPHRLGAEIIFCDIDPKTYMMDPKKLQALLVSFYRAADGSLRTAKGHHVKMIIPIHLFGTCCDMDAIMALAQEYGVSVVEDAAQVMGADYPSKQNLSLKSVDVVNNSVTSELTASSVNDTLSCSSSSADPSSTLAAAIFKAGSKKAGAIAEMSFVSLYPTKNLGAFGDAGLIVCIDPKMAERIRIIRNHGMEERYYHKVVGGNFRMDGIQAAILRARLPFLAQWNEQRQKNAAIYKEAFTKAGLLDRIALPAEPWAASGLKNSHIFHQYVVRMLGEQASAQRDTVIAHLNKKNIGYAIYYPVPLHLQECFAYLNNAPGSYPESERAAQETLALPIFPELKKEEIQSVVSVIAESLAYFN